ncbi:MAG: electron transport complex subunit RsxC [Beggiatoa sp. IS2]|nr:MAG: electron transport complex subunit RsxC [Beggiatoa sp. IS2]
MQLLLGRSTFSHGVHPPGLKDTGNEPIRRLPFAPEMSIPLSQHFGAPSEPIVHEGQEVVRGEPLGKADGFMSVPVHAPATGVIERIALMPTARGPKAESIILKLHPSASQRVLYSSRVTPLTPFDIDIMRPKDLIAAVQDTGIVGLGGAAFPTHVKLSVPKGHVIDTVLINGCECEPYITADHRVMIEQAEDMLMGIRIVMRILDVKRAIIGIEDNKMDAIEALRAKIPKDSPISVRPVQTKYPQGAEKMLIKAILGREVPSGKFPSNVGVGVYNVATMAQIGYLLPRGQGIIERVITITGPGIKKPGNYLVALGTPMGFVLKQLGYTGGAQHLILGGPMMGTSVASLDVPVTKGVTCILVTTDEEEEYERTKKVYACIKCAKCVEACPIHLNPSRLGILAAKHQYEAMEQKFHLNDCFECGCCSYVCPSGIPLVQYFRIAKAMNRENRQRELQS